jgi:hypothetical protein
MTKVLLLAMAVITLNYAFFLLFIQHISSLFSCNMKSSPHAFSLLILELKTICKENG